MQELKLSSQKNIKIIIDDKEYLVRKPKVKDQKALNEMIKGLDEKSPEMTEKLIEWLASLGLPKEVIDEMYAVDLSNFIENYLLDSKKK